MFLGINQTTAPIKIGILIKPNSRTNFKKALEIASSMWGGFFFPIIPIYKNIPQKYRKEFKIKLKPIEYYKNIINNYDVDIIIFDENLDKDYISKIAGDRVTQEISFLKKKNRSDYINHGIKIDRILTSIIKSEFKYKRNDNLKISIVKLPKGDLFLNTFLGALGDNYKNQIYSKHKEEHFFEMPNVNISNLHKTLSKESLGLFELSNYKINPYAKRHWLKGIGIYFLKTDSLYDLNTFWNLRALGWNIIPIPISQIENPYFIGLIERFTSFYQNESESLNLIKCLLSTSFDNREKQKVIDLLQQTAKKLNAKKLYVLQRLYPRYWENKSVLEADKVECCNFSIDSNYEQIESEDNFVKFNVKKLPFKTENTYSRANYKVRLSISYFDEYAKKAGVIHGIDTRDWIRLTQSFDAGKWRISKSGLNYLVNDEFDSISFTIPNALPFFKKYFSKRSFVLNETPNGKLAEEVLKNLGGIRGTYLLSNASILKIIEEFEDGNILTFSSLLGLIKKYTENQNGENIIYWLLDKKMIELGANIKCKVCNQRTFYVPNELDIELTCSVCRNKFKFPTHKPSEAKWSYRGIGPFSRNNKVGGLLSVFLCLKLLKEEFAGSLGSISALVGFELNKKGEKPFEIDLGTLVQRDSDDEENSPELFISECKTYKKFTSKDFTRMKQIGKEFPNSILAFATLNETLNDFEKKELTKLVKYFRKGIGSRPINPVLILTAKELMPKDYLSSFAEYRDDSKPYIQNDKVGTLCDKTVEKYLNIETWSSIQLKKWKEDSKKRKLLKDVNTN